MPTGKDKKHAKTLSDITKEIFSKQENIPKVADLAASFFGLAGGAQGVAKMMWDEYNRPDCSAYVRSKILATVLDATRFAENQRGDGELGDISNLTTEDIEAQLGDFLKNMTNG